MKKPVFPIPDRKWFKVMLCGGVVCFGMLRYAEVGTLASDNIRYYTTVSKQRVLVKGEVVTDPYYSNMRWGRQQVFLLKVSRLYHTAHWQDVSGVVRVSVDGAHDAKISYGDRLLAEGYLSWPRPPQYTETFDYGAHFSRRGINALLSVRPRHVVERVSTASHFNVFKKLFSLKHYGCAMLEKSIYVHSTVSLKALLFGDRTGLPREVKECFSRSGTFHVFAISGLHVGLIAALVFICLNSLMISRRMSSTIVLLIVVLYAVMTGMRPPVVRAAIMLSVIMMGRMLYRPHDIYQSLSASALFILLYNPRELFDAGFQLSFTAVLAIVIIAPIIKQLLNALFPLPPNYHIQEKLYRTMSSPPSRWRYIKAHMILHNWLIMSVSVSVAAWLGVGPLIAYYFHLISFVGVLANIVVVPTIAVIIFLGYSFLFGMKFCTCITHMIAPILNALLAGVMYFSSWCADLPGAYIELRPFSVWWVVGVYVILSSFVYFACRTLGFHPLLVD